MENSKLDKDYWNNRYANQQTNWDLGVIAAPLKEYADQLKDKDIAILIPGCGHAHEAEYLLEQGFKNLTLIDIAPAPVQAVSKKFEKFIGKQLQIINGDFFELQQKFDLIIEQTFFCALQPDLRESYVEKMFDLLQDGGKLVGVLFNREFEGGPPFGGSKIEYEQLLEKRFKIKTMEDCQNSIVPRSGSELFFIAEKKDH